MNTTMRAKLVGIAALSLSLARAAAAEETKADAAPKADSAVRADAARPMPRAEAAPSVRVRASHRVDVIAPGERVETIIDRMRAAPPSPGTDARTGDRLPVRAPDRGNAEGGPRGGGPVPGGPGGPRAAPTAGAPNSGGPPDRPHR